MYIKRKTEKENKLKKQHEINTKYLKYTLRLKKKTECTRIKILIVEEDSIDLITVSEESKPSQ